MLEVKTARTHAGVVQGERNQGTRFYSIGGAAPTYKGTRLHNVQSGEASPYPGE